MWKYASSKFAALFALAGIVGAVPAPVMAWGSAGHQYVGNLGWSLLNPNARRHVRELLGPRVSLGLLMRACIFHPLARGPEHLLHIRSLVAPHGSLEPHFT